MRIGILANTPAHVHLYRNFVSRMLERGHEVEVFGRDYDCTAELLDYYGLPHRIYGRQDPAFRSLVWNVPRQFFNIARFARSYDPDVFFGRGPYAVFAGAVARRPVALVIDSEPTEFGHNLSSRFARVVVSPRAFGRDLGHHHFTFEGVTETAYLDPDVFTPDPSVREELGVGPDEPFAIARFNAYDALHDVGLAGATPAERTELLGRLAELVTVFVSDESAALDLSSLPVRTYDLHPARIHDALAEAALLVTDTGTMATEAALLGTPTVRFVDEVQRSLGEFLELERHGLLVQPSSLPEAIRASERLLEDPSVPATLEENRTRYLARATDLTELLVDVAEQFEPGSEQPFEFPVSNPT